MITANDLGVDEVVDLGTQLVADAEGCEFAAYVTVGYWTCPTCKNLCTAISKLDRGLVVVMGGAGAAVMRSTHDQETFEAARRSHACVLRHP